MSTTNHHEDHRSQHNPCGYRRLENVWKYSCPPKNPSYSDFSNGNNCLCVDTNDRSSFDKAVISGKKWPVSNDTLGWKT